MTVVYSGKRLIVEPGRANYWSYHKGTDVYLRSIRCEIMPDFAEQVDDTACDMNGRYIGPGTGQANT